MSPLLLRTLLFATVAAAPLAQSVGCAGAILFVASTAFSRGSLGTGAGELLQRFDADELTGFGIDAAHPGMQVVPGVILGIKDFGFDTPSNLIDVTLYTEDPNRPNHPDLLHPLGGITGVTPVNSILNRQYILFPAPVLCPEGRDVFLGIKVPATSASFGGVRLLVLTSNSGYPQWDLAGPALPTAPADANSYCLDRNLTTNALTYLPRRQYLLDLLTFGPGGIPTAITNQASLPWSNAAPGASTLLSGLHPDAANPPHNAGRADDVGFLYSDFALPPGFPVVFVGSFDGFVPAVPLAAYVPGSVGGVCLPSASTFALGLLLLDGAQQACWVTTIPPGARNLLRGVSWAQQAIGFDVVVGVLRGSQCGKQAF